MERTVENKLELVRSFVGTNDVAAVLQRMKLDETSIDSLFGLDCAEQISIWLYTDPHGYSASLNKALRTQPTPEALAFADVLESAIRKLPSLRALVFRGIFREAHDKPRNSYAIGAMIEWVAFTSTSRKASAAFAGDVTFQIHSKTGRVLQGYTAEEAEEEVLFPPRSRFRVLNCIEFGPNVAIELEEVDS